MVRNKESYYPAYWQKHKTSRVAFLFWVLVTGTLFMSFLNNTATAATYYVDDAKGNDSNPGTSVLPWKSWSKVQSTIVSGDTVCMTGDFGSISFTPTDPFGTSGSWITYRNWIGKSTPTFDYIDFSNVDGNGDPVDVYIKFINIHVDPGYLDAPNPPVVNMNNSAHVVFDGCYFEGEKINGVEINQGDFAPYFFDHGNVISAGNSPARSSYITVQNSTIKNDYIGIYLAQHPSFPDRKVENWTIVNNDISNTAEDCITIGVSGYHTITDNYFHDTVQHKGTISWPGTETGDWSNKKWEQVTQDTTGAVGLFFEISGGRFCIYPNDADHLPLRNTTYVWRLDSDPDNVYFTPSGVGDNPHTDMIAVQSSSHDMEIKRNKFHSYDTLGAQTIKIEPPASNISFIDNEVRQDVYVPVSCMLIGGTNTQIYNNTIVTVSNSFRLITDGSGSDVHFYNNIISRAIYTSGTIHSNYNIWSNTPPSGFNEGSNSVIVSNFNGVFAEQGNFDFNLAPGSVAIDFGNSDYAPLTDILGASRVFPPDAGCYEYIPSDSNQAPIIVDHNSVAEYDQIPQSFIDEVKKMLLNYPGESHSRALFYGLELLEQQDSRFAVNATWFGAPESPTDQHLRIFSAHWTGSQWVSSTGEEDTYTNQAAIDMMNNHISNCKNTLSNNIDAFAFGWCWDMTWHNSPGGGVDPVYNVRWAGSSVGGPQGDLRWGLDDGDTALTGNSVNMQTYLDALNYYAQNNPDTTIIYSTGPVDGGGNTGESGYQRYLKNEFIRDHVKNSENKYLFDYADIISHNNAGDAYTTTWDDHTFPYIHPDNVGNYDGGDGGCHISQEACIRLAKAMWVLLAKKAGWNGSGTTNYTLNISVNGNGSVTKTPNKSSYNLGEEVTLQAVPNAGYSFVNWSGDLSGSSNPTTIVMNSNKSITANFTANTYTITASAGSGGQISPSGSTQVYSGGSQAYTISANAGYHIADVLVDGSSVGAVGSYTFTNVTANHTIAASFAVNTFTIIASAGSGGQISPSGSTQVSSGGSQVYTISANTGYHIADILVDGSSVGAVSGYTFTSVTANHTIAASFAVNTYTITASAGIGGQISPSGSTQFVSGGSQLYTISANTGYHIANVLVDGSSVGVVSSYNFTNITASHTIAATFAVNTYTITASAGSGGQISPVGTTQVNAGDSQMYTITANAGYHVANVLVDGGSIGAVSSYTFSNVTRNHTISASFDIDETDVTAPTVMNLSPQADYIQSPLNSLITLHITDSGDGVDAGSVTIQINNNLIYSGDTAKYSSAYGECYRTGTEADYTFIYQSNERFNFNQEITVTVNAKDLAGNVMDEYSYSFQTKMRSFGKNKKINKNKEVDGDSVQPDDSIHSGGPTTCSDSEGNIWVAWHSGATGNKDIYVNKLAAGARDFGDSIKLTNSTADQRNPAIAIGSDDKLYVAWQDSRNGNWDIYVSTSTDGVNWSAERRVTDSNDNQINPDIIINRSLPNNAYIAWEDSRNGNQDIYIGASSNGFVTTTASQITSDLSSQVEPAIAVDSDNTVYVVWTDRRNSGNNDIYGAASNSGPWTNIPIVTEDESQSSPVIATESVGSILHLAWVDYRAGENDIYYAKTSGGLPASPLTGSNIIDEPNSDQKRPAIAVDGSTGSNLRIFVCWEDDRNGDNDLYLSEVNSGSGTNVFVGDDGTNTDQTEPAIGIDGYGQPYLVWVDGRNMNADIYYAGSTFVEPDVFASGNVSPSSTITVGTALNAIDSIEDVSVEVPQGAYPCDIKITISKVQNSQEFDFDRFGGPYEFGPSGIDFVIPVTITIPYEVNGSDTVVYTAYWYNPLTNSLSQQGITDIETVVISSTLHALRFKTSHFTQFLIGGNFGGYSSSSSGGGGGGGCSMSPDSQASAAELLLPYLGLIVAMIVLKLRDRRKRKTCNIT